MKTQQVGRYLVAPGDDGWSVYVAKDARSGAIHGPMAFDDAMKQARAEMRIDDIECAADNYAVACGGTPGSPSVKRARDEALRALFAAAGG